MSDPFFARYPSTTTSVPTGSELLFHPCLRSWFGAPISIFQDTTLPVVGSFTSMYSHECGLIQSILLTAPFNVTGLFPSNSAENAWCAHSGTPSSIPPIPPATSASVVRIWSASLLARLPGHDGFLPLFLGWINVDACGHQDSIPVSFVTRILEELVIWAASNHGVKRNRERAGERLRVLNRRFVVNDVLVDRRITLDHVKVRAMNDPVSARRCLRRLIFADGAVAEHPRVVVEVCDVHHERIALPAATRIAHRQS